MSSTEAAQLEARREATRQMWNAAAPGWEEHAGFVDARGLAVTRAMVEGVDPRPGERVLELACGPGGVGLEAAARVGPDGLVVLSDLAPEMLRVAAARAASAGSANVEVRLLDAERIDEPDAAYDVVVCREGLMLVADPARALVEMRRVLCSTGRVAIAVWGPRDANPWLGALFDAVTGATGLPVPPPGVPGPFALDDAAVLGRLLLEVGFEGVDVQEVDERFETPSFEEWWRVVPALAGPIAAILASLPTEVTDAIRTEAAEALEVHATPSGFSLPGVSLVATGRAPA